MSFNLIKFSCFLHEPIAIELSQRSSTDPFYWRRFGHCRSCGWVDRPDFHWLVCRIDPTIGSHYCFPLRTTRKTNRSMSCNWSISNRCRSDENDPNRTSGAIRCHRRLLRRSPATLVVRAREMDKLDCWMPAHESELVWLRRPAGWWALELAGLHLVIAVHFYSRDQNLPIRTMYLLSPTR